MAADRIFITVKTYPTPDPHYFETVCTAGFREDGSWVRLTRFLFVSSTPTNGIKNISGLR